MPPLARRITTAALAAAVASLAAAGAAHGATIVGADLSRTPDLLFTSSSGAVATAVAAPTGAPFPVTPSAAGVIVRIRQRYGPTRETPGAYAFRILTGTNPYLARGATVDGGELRLPLISNSTTGATMDYQPVDALGRRVGIPIAAGEHLALAHLTQGGQGVQAFASASGASYDILSPSATGHLSGEERYFNNGLRYELLLQAVIEPDADGDRLGDETQDQCPGVRNDPTTLACPALTVTREVRVEVPVARCRVPLLRGLTRRFASRLLTASGCTLGSVRTRTVRRGLNGRVVGQSARANAVLAPGAGVGITLSRRAARRRR